ncbi:MULTISPECIES: protein-L-isoaspartate(D-aspartate) O-methyltransferase [Weeksella]|uniref:Protein-L-isoaspartate O-methyltransferase n=1 Tax=Weeksella virosa (strain ATCC 43766 / DSM 16922 / JCM 21250 / CCUG 30538 / CDC 9751 / IAM 14551 / NBRC 16016 / NCTC 11634 / CL345/78) TaxID=865938 RepID=F0P2Y2_WEEVC|nr:MULTISPECIES: protein-L-isoaspartate(D-aspartate) O-methyltransferase [Weeksella]ADX67894.1 Protein-L-isoaspartate O-methyltransferase [Weeksella virosa DSM 16922]MDK7374183.1 protein-L-isoaspartate(D-aspartate) O-methyltransferase [Weeksella virosa]MDK7674495.1 protein-L-isoaspartate(D-aspartate) O-methyltransferase [Weeksella virosa]OFM82859.1 protein-L-isoaspartate O-methyltransferase [Weeksella sp. HMSC059D05]SUP54197.1 Protein-L-isoaspartate O-methyltransferase [Weeksella virosa]
MPVDEFKHKGKRKQLMELLYRKGIEDEKVLKAMNNIPRHLFIDSAFEEFAYRDEAFPIASGQTISHPYTVAFQTSLLHVHEGEKVLEIGTGSGYQTAVLVELGAEVFSIERQKELYDFSRLILNKINKKPRYQTFGDGYKGLPAFAPFDKIIVTAGAPYLPEELLKQLKLGGIMVIPIGKENQKMYTYLRLDDHNFEVLEFGDYQFVPMLENTKK